MTESGHLMLSTRIYGLTATLRISSQIYASILNESRTSSLLDVADAIIDWQNRNIPKHRNLYFYLFYAPKFVRNVLYPNGIFMNIDMYARSGECDCIPRAVMIHSILRHCGYNVRLRRTLAHYFVEAPDEGLIIDPYFFKSGDHFMKSDRATYRKIRRWSANGLLTHYKKTMRRAARFLIRKGRGL